jgi:hypothetical protein
MFRKTLLALLLTASGLVHAQIPISGLPPATTPLGANDKILVNQPISGTVYSTRQAPLSALAPFFPPITSHYVLQAADPLLPQSRTLVGTANQVIISDGGALGNLTLSLPQSICVTCGPTFSSLTLTGLLNGFSGVFSSTLQSAGYTGTTGLFSSTLQAASLSLTTPLQATSGGTGFGSYAVGDLLAASTTTALSKLPDVAAGSYLRSGGINTLPLWSTLTLPNAATTGDVLIATGTNTIGSLVDVTAGSYLRSNGAGVAPVYSTVKIPNTTVTGDIWYGSAANTISALTGNITTGVQFLAQTGSGAASAAPVWTTLPGSFTGFANPSGLIGLTAANGVATTATRSDATHALDQTISPTMSGTWDFTGSISTDQTTGRITINSTTATNASGINVNLGGANKGRFLVEGTAGATVTGSAINDTIIYNASSNIDLSANSGAHITQRLTSGDAIQGWGTTSGALVDMTPDTGTFTVTYTGFTTTVSCTATWSRMGKIVVLTFCPATGTSNATTMTASGIPSAIQPPTLGSQFVLLPGSEFNDNGANLPTIQVEVGVVQASGTWSFFKAGSSSAWTAAGTKGLLSRLNVTYQLN